jgi:IMP dehydrogenase
MNGDYQLKVNEALAFDDILLAPQYSDIESRKEIDVGNNLCGNIHLDLPIISSPMDTVTDKDMAIAMSNLGGLGIIHRYNTIQEQVNIIKLIRKKIKQASIAAAVGVTNDFLKRAVNLFDAGVNILCIDVAHGHHILVRSAIRSIRNELGKSVHIMAGNVATLEAFNDLSDWGANSIRVGIGGGSICSTRTQTGHGIPTLASIYECAKSDRDSVIVADGGIRTSGDMIKSFAAGADFVMVGSMLAGSDETPGSIFKTIDGESYKIYRGMASKGAQIDWRGEYSSNEGISTTVDCKGPVAAILADLESGIRSGLSYSGARSIRELHSKARFIKQTNAGINESSTHILKRSRLK